MRITQLYTHVHVCMQLVCAISREFCALMLEPVFPENCCRERSFNKSKFLHSKLLKLNLVRFTPNKDHLKSQVPC